MEKFITLHVKGNTNIVNIKTDKIEAVLETNHGTYVYITSDYFVVKESVDQVTKMLN